jgi:ribosomal protein L12E/L44/L45/RPP1/RPP2
VIDSRVNVQADPHSDHFLISQLEISGIYELIGCPGEGAAVAQNGGSAAAEGWHDERTGANGDSAAEEEEAIRSRRTNASRRSHSAVAKRQGMPNVTSERAAADPPVKVGRAARASFAFQP